MEKNILAHSGMGQDNKIAMFVVCVLLWLAQLVVYECGSSVLTSTAEQSNIYTPAYSTIYTPAGSLREWQQGIDIHSRGGGLH